MAILSLHYFPCANRSWVATRAKRQDSSCWSWVSSPPQIERGGSADDDQDRRVTEPPENADHHAHDREQGPQHEKDVLEEHREPLLPSQDGLVLQHRMPELQAMIAGGRRHALGERDVAELLVVTLAVRQFGVGGEDLEDELTILVPLDAELVPKVGSVHAAGAGPAADHHPFRRAGDLALLQPVLGHLVDRPHDGVPARDDEGRERRGHYPEELQHVAVEAERRPVRQLDTREVLRERPREHVDGEEVDRLDALVLVQRGEDLAGEREAPILPLQRLVEQDRAADHDQRLGPRAEEAGVWGVL